jgi:murein L,D-transpeptidase YcbB/YkuD
VRVENPYLLAEKILRDTTHFSVEKIGELIQKGKTKTVKLSTPVSVYILYQTAGTEPNGDFVFRKDLYGRDTEILKALDEISN